MRFATGLNQNVCVMGDSTPFKLINFNFSLMSTRLAVGQVGGNFKNCKCYFVENNVADTSE